MSKVKVQNKRGFTILEVCLALVVMGVIAATVVPGFGLLYRQNAKRFADTFLLDMEKQRTKGKSLPVVKYYIRLTGTSKAITIGTTDATGFDSYVTGNEKFDGKEATETDTFPAIPEVEAYQSEPYNGTHEKVSMGMLIDGANADGKTVYFDGKGAYTLDDPLDPDNKTYINTITLGVWVDGKEAYRIEVDGVTGKTTWTML